MVQTDIVERLIRYQNGQTIEGTSVDMARTALSEIEKLRAEVERLGNNLMNVTQERDDLRAEIERLRSRTVTLPPMPEYQAGTIMQWPQQAVFGRWVSIDSVKARDDQIVAALRAAGVEVA